MDIWREVSPDVRSQRVSMKDWLEALNSPASMGLLVAVAAQALKIA
jgi:hypothetical protein